MATSATIGARRPVGAPTKPAPRLRPWQWLVAVAVFGAVFVGALPRFAAYDAVWSELRSIRGSSIGVLAVVGLWNLATYSFQLMAALPGLRIWQAALSNNASTAVANTVPGGGAWGATLTWTMYRRWGFSTEDAAGSMLVTMLCNNAIKLALPLVAVVIAAVRGDDMLAPEVGGISAIVLVGFGLSVAAALRFPWLAARMGAAAGRGLSVLRRGNRNWGQELTDRLDAVRRDAADVFARRWAVLALTTVVSHVSLYLVLLASLRAVGVESSVVPWSTALVAFALVRVALLVPLTPGGAGVAELGLAGALVAAGGPGAEVLAGVLLFRGLTWLAPIALGAVAYLLWLRGLRTVVR